MLVLSPPPRDENEFMVAATKRCLLAGHSLLNLLAGEHLFRQFPDDREGPLTRWRDFFLWHGLAVVGERLGLEKAIRTSIPKANVRTLKSTLCLATKITFGWIHGAYGMDAARKLFAGICVPVIQGIIENWREDPRAKLRELVKQEFHSSVHAETVSQSSDGGAVSVKVECLSHGVVLGRGQGRRFFFAELAAFEHAFETIESWRPLLQKAYIDHLRARRKARKIHNQNQKSSGEGK